VCAPVPLAVCVVPSRMVDGGGVSPTQLLVCEAARVGVCKATSSYLFGDTYEFIQHEYELVQLTVYQATVATPQHEPNKNSEQRGKVAYFFIRLPS
jgi:hypothetical protein